MSLLASTAPRLYHYHITMKLVPLDRKKLSRQNKIHDFCRIFIRLKHVMYIYIYISLGYSKVERALLP